MGLKRLIGFGGERMRLLRFLVVDMRRACVGFASVGLSVALGRGIVADFSTCMYRTLFLRGSLLILRRCVVWVRFERCRVGAGMSGMRKMVHTHDISIPRLS